MQIAEDFSYFEVHRLLWKYLPTPCCVKAAAATFRENQLLRVSQQNQGEWSHDRIPNVILVWMEIQFFVFSLFVCEFRTNPRGALIPSSPLMWRLRRRPLTWNWSTFDPVVFSPHCMGSDCLFFVCSQSYCAKEFIQKTITKSHFNWPRSGNY